MSGMGYYHNFLRDLSKRIRPITSLLRKGVKFEFTHKIIVREILAELATPPILVFPDWDAVADGSRPFQVNCDACIDGFGAALEQEQPDGSVRPIAYISRAAFDPERHWAQLGLEAGSIVWAIKRLRGYLWGTKFRVVLEHKALESIGRVGGPQCARPAVARVSHRVRLRTPSSTARAVSYTHLTLPTKA